MARSSLIPRHGMLGSGGVSPLLALHREMNRMFDDVFRGSDLLGSGREGGPSPVSSFINASIDVSETEKAFRITAELPGVAEEDIDVSLEDDMLTLRGEKRFERSEGEEKENYHFVERSYGTFQRSIRLPFHADPERVEAQFRNGVLTITVPKTQQQERSRRIPIQGVSGGQGTGRAPRTGTSSSAGEASATSSEGQSWADDGDSKRR